MSTYYVTFNFIKKVKEGTRPRANSVEHLFAAMGTTLTNFTSNNKTLKNYPNALLHFNSKFDHQVAPFRQ